MSDPIRVYINERPVNLPRGADVQAAVAAADPALAEALVGGRAHVTDGRGIRLGPDAPLAAGAILRVVISARRPEGDAHA
ncbi:MAG TPA: hypothetical protein VFS11_07890 [Gemmatimonadales bacterium]|nr:hypothetical protein [Gemmatimonadales bacterium]